MSEDDACLFDRRLSGGACGAAYLAYDLGRIPWLIDFRNHACNRIESSENSTSLVLNVLATTRYAAVSDIAEQFNDAPQAKRARREAPEFIGGHNGRSLSLQLAHVRESWVLPQGRQLRERVMHGLPDGRLRSRCEQASYSVP